MDHVADLFDLQIRISKSGGTTYAVEVQLNHEQQVSGSLDAAGLLPWVASGDVQSDGQRLGAALFADPALRDVWAAAQGRAPQRRVRLWIGVGLLELHALPWEALFADADFVAASPNTPFSRYLASPRAWGAAVKQRPLRILAAIANPADLDAYNLTALNVSAERASLEGALRSVAAADVHLDVLEAPITAKRLGEALQRGYHVLHFVGHGTYNKRRQQAALYLQGQDGDVQVLRDADFVNMLLRQGSQLRLVLLAACQSATTSTQYAVTSLAHKLVLAGLPAVIAMRGALGMSAAQAFSAAFYGRLLADSGPARVDVAVNAARAALAGLQSGDLAVPQLFMRLKSGLLWSAAPASDAAEAVLDQHGQVVVGTQANIADGDYVAGDKIVQEIQVDLPKLLSALREVLPDDDPAPQYLLEAFERFQYFHLRLYEWKELHNYLNDIIYVVDQFAREVERLDAQGLPGNPRTLARLWRPIAQKVHLLLDWARDEVSHISEIRLLQTPEGLQGPRWAVELSTAKRRLEALLQPQEFDLLALYDATYAFVDVADRQMYLADKQLRRAAGELYNLSRIVLGSMDHD